MGCLHISVECVPFVPEQKINAYPSTTVSIEILCVQWVSQTNSQIFPHALVPPVVVVIYMRYLPKAPKAIMMLCVGPDQDKPSRVKMSRGPFSQKHLYKQATLQMCQRTALFHHPSYLSKRFNTERRRLYQLVRRHTLGFAPLKEVLALRG